MSQLTRIQVIILECLIARKSLGHFSLPEIAEDADVSVSTARRAIAALKKSKNITTEYNPSDKRFTFSIHSNHSAIASIRKKCTFYTHPELGGWRQLGLKPGKILEWAKEFSLPVEGILQSLCYAAYDLEHNGKKKEKKIIDGVSWFYRIIERSRYYRRPANYKSYLEIDMEKREERKTELEKQIEMLRKARHDEAQAEHQLIFEKILSDPNSKEYQECMDNITFAMPEKNKNRSNQLFLSAMAESYKLLNNLENFEWK